MRLTPLKILAVSAVLSPLALLSGAAHAGGGKTDKLLAQLKDYRQWERVTREPVEVPSVPSGGG